MFIENTEDLSRFCEELASSEVLGFDTEFVRERTYYPSLEVLQLTGGNEIGVIDCQAIEDLEPLWKLLCDGAALKVVHSGAQDMELILQESGRLPDRVFDTQIGASFLGYGSQCGYGRLVSDILRKKISKVETFSDWTRRPLRAEQIEYAEKDVEHLLELYSRLAGRLEKKERLSWVEEECRYLSVPENFRRTPPDECFRKIKGGNSLDPLPLSNLRSLAEWREIEAQNRNVLPHRVIPDHVLISISKNAPKDREALKRQRGLHNNEFNRHAEDILQKVREGTKRSDTDPIEISPRTRSFTDDEDESVMKLLGAVLKIQADRARVAPSVLATTRDLRDLVAGVRTDDLEGQRLLSGWRREIAGERLLSVLNGEIALRICPKNGTLLLETVDV